MSERRNIAPLMRADAGERVPVAVGAGQAALIELHRELARELVQSRHLSR